MSDNTGNTQRFCGSCGARTTPGNAFCGSCGAGLSEAPPERRADVSSPPHSWTDGAFSRLRSLSGRDALAGVLVSVACAALLVAGIYALLFVRGVFEDPLVPKGVGFVIFALAHGGAVSVNVPQVPELFGLGGSATLGPPITSFALLPFVAALFLGRAVAARVGNAWLFALSAAFSYAVISGLLALLGVASVAEGGAEIRVAAEPLSTAVRAFLWVGLATAISATTVSTTAVSASAANLSTPPARTRQVIRGTLVAVASGLLLTVVLALVIALVTGGGSPTDGVADGLSGTDSFGTESSGASSGGSVRDLLSGVGGFVTLLPVILGNLWLFAHGLPVGLHGAPDLSGVPYLGEVLADVPLRLALLGEWPFGWEWRLLPLAPALGIFLGGMVAAGGAPPERRVWQGAAVAIPYTAFAVITALLVGFSAEFTFAGASLDVAVRASLAWMLLLPVAGAVIGGLGGLLAGEWSSFAPRPRLAFASTAALASILLVASLPVFAATSAPQNPLPEDPLALEEPMDEESLFEIPEEPEVTFPEDLDEDFEEDFPEEGAPDLAAISPGSPPDSTFDAILPTLRETTTAPIMLPAALPSDLRNTAVDAAYSGDEYGILFLAEPTGNVVEEFVRAYTLGTFTASPNASEPNEYFEETSSEAVSLPDGTEATLRYLEPTMEGGNAGPYWEGEFERGGYVYTFTLPLADPSGDIARQTLASMVEVPDEGDEGDEALETSDASGTVEQEFISEYYEAVGAEDWVATYYLLDFESQLEFTEDEWVAVQTARQDSSGAAPIESAEISDIRGEGASFTADVLLTYTDGARETVSGIEVYFEDGGFSRHLSESDVEFLRGIQEENGLTFSAGDEEDYSSEEFAVEEAVYSHYEAIGAGDFYGAYSYFGPSFRSSNDEASWVADEESYGITSATVDYVETLSVSEDAASVAVDVTFEDETGTPSFSLVWDLVKEDGIWKLDAVSGGEV